MVFSDVNGLLVTIYDNSHLSFGSTPSITISPLLTKIVINGVVSNALYVRGFHIDYTANTWKPISFPSEVIFDKSAVKIIVEENWLYIRQLKSSLRPSGGNSEYIYNIQLNTIPILVNSYPITTSIEDSWVRTILKTSGNNSIQFYSQITQTLASRIAVSMTQCDERQSGLGTGSNQLSPVSGALING